MHRLVRYPIFALLIAALPGTAMASSVLETMGLADAIRYVAEDPVEPNWRLEVE